MARVSEINLGLYRTFMQPWVRAFANEGLADLMRRMHPLRLPYEMFGASNPFMETVKVMAEAVRTNRRPVSADNVFWQGQQRMSEGIESTLEAYRDTRDRLMEAEFQAIYGSPALQALAGLRSADAPPRHRPGVDAVYRAFVAQRTEEITRKIEEGGPREAAIRALFYVRMPEGVADERGFRLLQRLREETGGEVPLAAFKSVARDQFYTLLLDEQRAVAAIPAMLNRDPELAARMSATLRRIIDAVEVKSSAGKERLAAMEALFEARGRFKPRPAHTESVTDPLAQRDRAGGQR